MNRKSVAMTTYNGEKYIKEQLMSILTQTVPANEIIICDDCSKDNTVNIIEKIVKENTTMTEIKLYRNKSNLGYIKNFYQAISLTKGDYIFLSDQDDIWHLDKIEKMSTIMQQMNCTALCTNFNLVNSEGVLINDKGQFKLNPFINKVKELLTPIKFSNLIFGNISQGCTYCFSKQVKDAYLQINSNQLIHDHQIMFIASLLGDVYFLNENLIDYRLHNKNAIGFNKKNTATKIKFKKPVLKPFMVQFLDDVDKEIPIPYKVFYKMLYYLRLPYFVSKIRN